MRLAKQQAWTSTFHLVVLMSISSFLGLLTIVDAHDNGSQPPPQRKREQTVAYRGVDHGESMFNAGNSAVVRKTVHPIYEAREFLVEHNIVRRLFGEPPLVWDRTLAHYARRFAYQRAANCDMIHTTDGPYGENIYWGANYFRHTAAAAVRAWAGEIHDYNPITNTCNPSKLCGHYKQIVWRASTKVGCARTKCNNGGVYIICSYDPPGNYEGENPFDIPNIVQGPPQSSQTPVAQTPPTPAANTPSTPVAQKTPTSVQTPKAPVAHTTLISVQTPPKAPVAHTTQISVPTPPKAPAAHTTTLTSPSTPS